MSDQRKAASDIVSVLADRLSKVVMVEELVSASIHDSMESGPSGAEFSLVKGYPGVSLLFAELARAHPAQRDTAHALLALATREHPPSGGSLYYGIPALAFAARMNTLNAGDYQGLLPRLDRYVAELAEALAKIGIQRLSRHPKATVGSSGIFDVITGLSGLLRYLVLAGVAVERSLRQVLEFLVELSHSSFTDGLEVPRWWVDTAPRADLLDDPAFAQGHANFGLAHGIAGPLAALSIAWREGWRVSGQEDAITCLVEWLVQWKRPLTGGVRWPAWITEDQYRGRAELLGSGASSWCYGVPGIARSIQLAGLALGREDWQDEAVGAMRSLLNCAPERWSLRSASICHGWAGLLQVTLRMAADANDDDGLLRIADTAAERTVALFDPSLPFGFTYQTGPLSSPKNALGLLEGTAGTALALHTYISDTLPKSSWDQSILIT